MSSVDCSCGFEFPRARIASIFFFATGFGLGFFVAAFVSFLVAGLVFARHDALEFCGIEAYIVVNQSITDCSYLSVA